MWAGSAPWATAAGGTPEVESADAAASGDPRDPAGGARGRGEVLDVERLIQQVEAWLDAPSDWGGPSAAGAERFRQDVAAALAVLEGDGPHALALRLTSLEERFPGDDPMGRLSALGRRALTGALVGPASSRTELWLLTRVVAPPRERVAGGMFRATLGERRRAVAMLERAAVEQLRTALLTVGRRAEDPLRPAALAVLGSWSARHGVDESVDAFLVGLLGEPFSPETTPHPFNLVLARVRGDGPPLAPRARRLLSSRVLAMIISADWRDVARAVRLSEGFPLDERVPMLLDALSVWRQREIAGRQVAGRARAQGDLVRALRDISGRFHGARPEPWIQWWIRVRQGTLPRPGTPEFEADRKRRARQPRSTASFFGVRPETDRVTFVIDASGSMQTGFGTEGRTRYEEAIEQMMRFLQGAPDRTRFGVILFSGSPRSTGDELLDVDPETLEKVRLELLARTPGGGTRLRPAIQQALAIGPDGVPDLERLELDTVVVLCDGQTEEGPGWVGPALDRVLPHHPVVFHCVHLGGRSDGALRALAEGSGGSFLRVGG